MSKTSSEIRRILVLPGGRSSDALVEQLAGSGEIRIARSFDEALESMRDGSVDLVVGGPSDFVALGRAGAASQANIILDSVGQGICIVGSNGRALYTNPAMRDFPEELTTQVCQFCRRSFAGGASGSAEGAPIPKMRRFELATTGDLHFEVTATPVLDEQRRLSQIVAVVWDVTAGHRLQQKLDAIDRAGRELAQLGTEATAQLSIEDRIRLLEDHILRHMHDLLHFDNFAVLLIDKKTEKLEFVLQHGMSERSKTFDIYARPEDNGISGYVAATGRSYICQDIRSDPRYLEGMPAARTSLTVPLRLRDKVIGVFNIESENADAFNEEDRQFAEILARYIAIALNTLDLMVTERFQATGRIADDVINEIAPPLNDILTDATTLQEEYIGHDDLRRRLGAICDNVTKVKQSIREVASPRGGLLGRRDVVSRDPVLAGKRVLVADDEDVIRETIESVLTKLGCEVETASDGAAAIALIENRSYAVVLADIKMPRKNGYEIFAAVKERSESTPVILMTGFGYDPNHSIVRARNEGLAAVLFKPFKVEQLLEDLRRAVSQSGASPS